MFKKVIAVMLVAALVTATVISFAADNKEDVKVFSLQQAIDYALENSPLIAISETAMKKAEVSYKEAKRAYNDVEDTVTIETPLGLQKVRIGTLEGKKVKEGYYLRQAEMGVTLAEKQKVQTEESIKFLVQNSYFEVIHAQENLDIQRSIVEAANTNMKITQQKYGLGTASEIEKIASETAFAQAKNNLKAAERALEYAKMSFNKTLDLPLDTKIELTSDLEIIPPDEVDLDEKVNEALENRLEIISAKQQNELLGIEFDIISKMYPELTSTYQKVKYATEQSQYQLEQTKSSIELAVRKAYMDMMDAYEAVNVLDKSVEQTEKAYEVTKTKYESGMATNNEVLEAINALREVKLQRAKMLLSYNLAKKQFELSYGVGLN